MCRDGWCLGRTLYILSGLLEAAVAGEVPQQALCVRVCEAVDASSATYIRFDTRSRLCMMTCWPHTVDILSLKIAVEHLPRAYPLLFTHIIRENRPSCVSADVDLQRWHGSEAELLLWDVLGCRDAAQVPLHTSSDQLRLIMLARQRSFSARDMHLLRVAQRPLAAWERLFCAASSGEATVAGADAPRQDTGILTLREAEVLRMLAEGLLARTIAARMQISTRTVHKHLGSVYRKLDAHDRLLAVHRAQALGLIPAQRTPAGQP